MGSPLHKFIMDFFNLAELSLNHHQSLIIMFNLLFLVSLVMGSILAYAENSVIEYSAIQTIDTTPGPFINHIYIAANKQRQDANLGGTTVSTIIRHDKGVAWLLMPKQKMYQEIDIHTVKDISVQTQFLNAKKTQLLGTEKIDGILTTKYAMKADNDEKPIFAWFSTQGIIVKAEIPENPETGRPKASIQLKNIKIGSQDASLFELPNDYLPLKSQ